MLASSAIYTATITPHYHPSCFPFNPLFVSTQQLHLQHLMLQQQGLKHFEQLGHWQQFTTQLGIQHFKHLGFQEQFMQQDFGHSGHLGLQHLNLQHLLVVSLVVLDLVGRWSCCRIFLRRILVFMFSISWINLQRCRM